MSHLTKYDPFAELSALQKQFLGDGWMKGFSIPTTDVYTNDKNEIVVEAHLPNFEQDDISIEVDDNALIIQAERHEKEEDKKKKYVVREASSSFYRRIQLPDRAKVDSIEAHLEDGVLKVIVPQAEAKKPKKISVKTRSK